jgi:hypothetical protein
MLEKLVLKNFRGFSNHSVPLGPTTLVVGRNNAGKSTIVEALRLLSLVVNRAPFLTYVETPGWLDLPVGHRGVIPSLKGIDFELQTVCHRLNDPPAIIAGHFENGARVSVYLNPNQQSVFAVLSGPKTLSVNSRAQVTGRTESRRTHWSYT